MGIKTCWYQWFYEIKNSMVLWKKKSYDVQISVVQKYLGTSVALLMSFGEREISEKQFRSLY